MVCNQGGPQGLRRCWGDTATGRRHARACCTRTTKRACLQGGASRCGSRHQKSSAPRRSDAMVARQQPD